MMDTDLSKQREYNHLVLKIDELMANSSRYDHTIS